MNLSNRKFVVLGFFLLIGLLFIIRLFYLQIIEESWSLKAADLTERRITQYPSRGLVYDRNGALLVTNRPIYNILAVPKDIKNLDSLAFCELCDIPLEQLRDKLKAARKYSRYKASPIVEQIEPRAFARISEQLYKYPGFQAEPRNARNYTLKAGAHVLGEVGEVSGDDIKRNPYYKMRDYIGKSGIEDTYEEALRGVKGCNYVLIDVMSNIQGPYLEGRYDTLAQSGQDLHLTLDAELQKYGEKLMQNKRGSIVAIDPSTGEILALISSPTFDPNLLVGKQRGNNYAALRNDTLSPLYNRAIQGEYRPGSIFKLVQSLIALQEGVITNDTRITCNRGIIGCHGAHSYDDLTNAIVHSCNPYFHQVMKRMVEKGRVENKFKDAALGLEDWKKRIEKFGFGSNLGTDIRGARSGHIPGPSYYDKYYGQYRWAHSTIYSISIGEGEIGTTPLQMANLACILANRGFYYRPHIIGAIGGNDKPQQFREKQHCGVDAKHFPAVIEAMQRVIEQPGGTARRAKTKDITVCGKTGTVQNDPIKDHSVFIAFAPKDNPKIAISVYVEYSGYGGTWAAPISSLMIEKYLKGEISDEAKEKRILEASFLTK